MIYLDIFGWLAYGLSFLGTRLVGKKNRTGWLLRIGGDIGWAILGLYLGMTSIIACSIIFAVIDYQGWREWEDIDQTGGQSTD